MTATTPQRMTAEEFWQKYQGRKFELVRGEVREQMPTGGMHAKIASRIHLRLALWAAQNGGEVGFEAGFRLSRDPDVLRAPDVYYVAPEHIPLSGVPIAFWSGAPDLAVEVISPSETAGEVAGKVSDFLLAGTPLVWVVYFEDKQVFSYSPDDAVRVLKPGGALEHETLLPGFKLPLEELFR